MPEQLTAEALTSSTVTFTVAAMISGMVFARRSGNAAAKVETQSSGFWSGRVGPVTEKISFFVSKDLKLVTDRNARKTRAEQPEIVKRVDFCLRGRVCSRGAGAAGASVLSGQIKKALSYGDVRRKNIAVVNGHGSMLVGFSRLPGGRIGLQLGEALLAGDEVESGSFEEFNGFGVSLKGDGVDGIFDQIHGRDVMVMAVAETLLGHRRQLLAPIR
nr:hypothetical protein Iba_chr12bCG20200 [Ipomoea batatas]